MYWGLWYGGPSYAPSYHDEAEAFPSLRAAADEHWRRECGSDPYYPTVTDSETWLYGPFPAGTPRESVSFDYPDRIITIGPRGGVRVERA